MYVQINCIYSHIVQSSKCFCQRIWISVRRWPQVHTKQWTTHTFLGFCLSHKCMFLQMANRFAKVGAFFAVQPQSDTWKRDSSSFFPHLIMGTWILCICNYFLLANIFFSRNTVNCILFAVIKFHVSFTIHGVLQSQKTHFLTDFVCKYM